MKNAALNNLINLTKAINTSLGWHRHPRNGKVARLPEPTRNAINAMLEDGLPYRAILERLQHPNGPPLQNSSLPPLPYPLSEMNLSNWYRGGYRDWLRNKSKIAGRLVAPKSAAGGLVAPESDGGGLVAPKSNEDGLDPAALLLQHLIAKKPLPT